MNFQIITNGQTCAARGAMNLAGEFFIDCGGWGTEGYMGPHSLLRNASHTSDHMINAAVIAVRNVASADGTVVIRFGEPLSKYIPIRRRCEDIGHPLLLLDGLADGGETAGKKIANFIKASSIRKLHVTGLSAGVNWRSNAETARHFLWLGLIGADVVRLRSRFNRGNGCLLIDYVPGENG